MKIAKSTDLIRILKSSDKFIKSVSPTSPFLDARYTTQLRSLILSLRHVVMNLNKTTIGVGNQKDSVIDWMLESNNWDAGKAGILTGTDAESIFNYVFNLRSAKELKRVVGQVDDISKLNRQKFTTEEWEREVQVALINIARFAIVILWYMVMSTQITVAGSNSFEGNSRLKIVATSFRDRVKDKAIVLDPSSAPSTWKLKPRFVNIMDEVVPLIRLCKSLRNFKK